MRRQREQVERRKSILKAAREVFFKKGFMAATMDAIADRCGLAKGTIYLYFKSKEELYVSLMAEGMGLLKKELEKIIHLPLPSDKLLGEVLQTYYTFYQRKRQYFRIMFLSSQPDVRERVPDDLLRQCMDSARDCMRILSDVIQGGVESEVFREVNPWAVANILWSTVNGIIMSYEQGPLYRDEIVGLTLEEILRASLDLVLEGLRSGT
jgi:TetR/AcrR family transcriptional regulator